MTFLRGSVNYVWCTTSVLGKGATGAVFQGVNKHNGEPVAVKTFNQLSHMRPHEVQMREFDVLRKVNHKNIVKLLAVEEEQEGRGKVIVMELCTGGSLFNMLDDPENAYGLEEVEFFLVLRHLSDGMKHLRDLNLVHRDLKPGNIMKYIDVDGTTIYKLTDFGAARELDDDQQFISLYGTEEYLHPDMYERAVLRKSVGKSFRATVDLWSIGVTLYHVSTGQLPFRPHGGRKNKETMHVITTKKKPGIISGIQTSEGGDIQWSQDLPDTCQLSLGAKSLVTPLLAGLLEVDHRYMWTFERFFEQVTAMTSRLRVPVFFVNRLESLTLYLLSDDKYEAIQEAVQQQTGIIADNQVMLLAGRNLLEYVSTTTTIQQYPAILCTDQPIVLFDKQNNDVTLHNSPPLPKFPTIPQTLSVENDAVLAKMACGVAHELHRRVSTTSRSRKLIDEAVQSLSGVLAAQLADTTDRLTSCQKLSSVLGHQVSLLTTSHQFTVDYISGFGETAASAHTLVLSSQLQSLKDLYDKVSEQQREVVESGLPELQRRMLVSDGRQSDGLLGEWRRRSGVLSPPVRAPACAATYTAKIRDSWQHLFRDRTARNLTYNDEQFHHLEKVKLAETGISLHRLLEKQVTPDCLAAAELLSDWYKLAQTCYIKSDIASGDVSRVEQLMDRLNSDVTGAQLLYIESLSAIRQSADAPVQNATSTCSIRLTMTRLQELEAAMTSVWRELHENECLTSQLENLISKVARSSSPLL